jgi:secondary thiamine-phosphate synthase enzyme
VTAQVEVQVDTKGEGDIIDLTRAVTAFVNSTGIRTGTCHVYVGGSTAAITTIEYEPGLKRDFPALLQQLAPREAAYEHNERWGDGNGFSHVRASLIGPDITVPIAGGSIVLGTWQQPVLVECDNRARNRVVYLTAMGE